MLKIFVGIMFLMCLGMLIGVNIVPKGNFIAAPALTMFFFIPIVVLQLLIVLTVFGAKREQINGKLACLVSIGATSICLYLFINYLVNNH
jgi:hypothetical protein